MAWRVLQLGLMIGVISSLVGCGVFQHEVVQGVRIFPAQVEQVHQGMTVEEVSAQLGAPSFSAADKVHYVIALDQVSMPMYQQYLTSGKQHLELVVEFSDGRCQSKRYRAF